MTEHSEEMDDLLETAVLGVEAERFMATKVGQYLWQKADEKISAAQAAWIETDPHDSRRMLELQNDAKLGAMFKTWICDMIDAGRHAELEINREENDS